jgi:hypothetical protein
MRHAGHVHDAASYERVRLLSDSVWHVDHLCDVASVVADGPCVEQARKGEWRGYGDGNISGVILFPLVKRYEGKQDIRVHIPVKTSQLILTVQMLSPLDPVWLGF